MSRGRSRNWGVLAEQTGIEHHVGINVLRPVNIPRHTISTVGFWLMKRSCMIAFELSLLGAEAVDV